jgi:hypothetical protein
MKRPPAKPFILGAFLGLLSLCCIGPFVLFGIHQLTMTHEEMAREAEKEAAEQETAARFGDKFDATFAAERAVRGQLIHPSTADFVIPGVAKHIRGGHWNVVGEFHVTTNSGLIVPFRYRVTFRYETGEYTVVNCVVEGRSEAPLSR